MSRNFELLRQLDIEAGATESPRPSAADRISAVEVAPILSRQASSVSNEEMLRLIQRVFLSAKEGAPKQVVLCGVDSENGSSSVCAMAGRTLAANTSRRVCLVDANVRSPRLAGMLGLGGTNPFSGTSAPLRDQCAKVGNNLWLAGPSMLADKGHVLLPPVELKEHLTQLRGEFEYLLIDAPGTTVCGDAQLLALISDAAILVIEANSTRRLTARNAKEVLDVAGVRLLGTVLHNRSFPIPRELYKRL